MYSVHVCKLPQKSVSHIVILCLSPHPPRCSHHILHSLDIHLKALFHLAFLRLLLFTRKKRALYLCVSQKCEIFSFITSICHSSTGLLKKFAPKYAAKIPLKYCSPILIVLFPFAISIPPSLPAHLTIIKWSLIHSLHQLMFQNICQLCKLII